MDASVKTKMRFKFNKIKKIPKLAWAIRIDKGADCVVVHHGQNIETGDDYFIEGAWAGDFSKGLFDTTTLMGSGGRVTEDTLVLACPNHTLDRIYSYRDADALYASNSLPFLLAHTNTTLDDEFLFYDALLASIVDGLDKFERTIPASDGRQIRLHYHCNIHIDRNLTVSESPKVTVPVFVDYEDYIDYLKNQVAAIYDNATDTRRSIQYSPKATISKGYDSPACAAFAADIGCQTALTFSTARGRNGPDDSGHLIAKHLGLEVRSYDRLGYRELSNFPEAECGGGPSEFSSFAEELNDTILFAGFLGGDVWNVDVTPTSNIVRSDAGGFGLTELRLRTGFIMMPVPFIGCTSLPSIKKISNSAEMGPWRLGNKYDRPIPRRFLEDRGIQRDWFGTSKRAAGVYVTEEGIEETLSPHSFQDFTAFCERRWRTSFQVKSSLIRVARFYSHFCKRANRVLARAKPRVTRRIFIPNLLPRQVRIRTYGYTGREALLFHWGISKMIKRYEPHLLD
jgi:hypothetical protein